MRITRLLRRAQAGVIESEAFALKPISWQGNAFARAGTEESRPVNHRSLNVELCQAKEQVFPRGDVRVAFWRKAHFRDGVQLDIVEFLSETMRVLRDIVGKERDLAARIRLRLAGKKTRGRLPRGKTLELDNELS